MERKKLAAFLVYDQFGGNVGKVAECLLDRGRSHLKEIQVCTGIPPKQVKECLMVLIQQNIVTAFLEEDNSVRYEIHIENIIMRLRFAKCVAHAKAQFGDEAEIVVEELIEHGRCSIERVITRATDWVIQFRGASAPITEERARAILRQKFDLLIANHYVIQADAPARAPPASVKSLSWEDKMKPAPGKKKAAPAPSSAKKPASILKPTPQSSTFSLNPTSSSSSTPSSSSASSSSSVPSSSSGSTASSSASASSSFEPTTTTATTTTTKGRKKKSEAEGEEAPKKRGKKAAEKDGDTKGKGKGKAKDSEAEPGKKKVGRKRKETEPPADIQFMPQDAPNVVLLESESGPIMPNPSTDQPAKRSKIVTTDRGVVVVDVNDNSTTQEEMDKANQLEKLWRINYDKFMVQFKIEEILKYVEEKFAGRSAEIVKVMFHLVERNLERKAALTPSVTIEALAKELASRPVTSNIPEADLMSYVDLMARYSPPVLARQGESGFQINMKNVVEVLRQKMVESVVHDKFGPHAMRIFRVLQLKRHLEQKSISEISLVPLREVCTSVYEMIQAGYIRLQEVPKIADHTPTKTYFLYTVDINSVYNTLVDDMSKGLFNLLARLASEKQKSQDVVERVALLNYRNEEPIEPDASAYARYLKIIDVMESAVGRLDAATTWLLEF
eukprot:Phypoly_transcript_04058.p1 GENE.Phypoly_transcript_04058~~Phypoly_transcript_04058.p1  ORF type:complete len:672 (+),score=150.11 Phypoly_transcript_04058:62-2077(+)